MYSFVKLYWHRNEPVLFDLCRYEKRETTWQMKSARIFSQLEQDVPITATRTVVSTEHLWRTKSKCAPIKNTATSCKSTNFRRSFDFNSGSVFWHRSWRIQSTKRVHSNDWLVQPRSMRKNHWLNNPIGFQSIFFFFFFLEQRRVLIRLFYSFFIFNVFLCFDDRFQKKEIFFFSMWCLRQFIFYRNGELSFTSIDQ